MAKILFISDNFFNESLGIMYLSSYLKSKGHRVQLTLLLEHKRTADFLTFVRDVDPDLIGFSVMTPQASIFHLVTKMIKENTDHTIIWGGSHCILMPKDVVNRGYVDIICISEGEEALLTLMDRLDANKDYSDIPNLWVKKDRWIKNRPGHLETNLDKYPFPDRELYYSKNSVLRNFSVKRFLTQRGCPYDCSYCFESVLKNLHKGEKFVRRHSVKYVVNEIKAVIRKYPTKTIHFSDDIFNLNEGWLKDFFIKYKSVGLPFTCNINVLHNSEEIISGLKGSGCNGVAFGLESGVETIRIKVLNKRIPNKRYIEASKLLREYQLKFIINTMFCLPTETLDNAIETIRFAKSLKPYGIRVSILKIYKGTALADFAVSNCLCEENEFTYGLENENRIENMLWAGYLLAKFPLLRFAKGLLNNPISRLLKPLVLLSYEQEIRFFRIPLWQAWRYFWQSKQILKDGIAKAQED